VERHLAENIYHYLPWIFKYSTGGKVIKLRVCSPTVIVRSKTFPQHEAQKIQTYVQKEFFLLQTNGNIHKSFVSALNNLNIDHHTGLKIMTINKYKSDF
jgi:hypothetical protein